MRLMQHNPRPSCGGSKRRSWQGSQEYGLSVFVTRLCLHV
jgi:hypothetical protein